MIRTIAPARLSTRWTLASFAIVAMAFSAICFYFLLEARRNYWEQAQQAANNLVAVIGNDIGRNIELYGLSLQAVVDNLTIPEIRSIRPELRDVILFDRAATAKYMGSILVINQDGDVTIESRNLNPKPENHSGRDYFTVHQARADVGQYVSWLNVDRSGQYVLGISRRLNHPNGAFAGVVVGTLRLQYFHDLFKKMNLGTGNSINLFRIDGTLLARNPHKDEDVGRDLSSAAFFANFQQKPSSGWFEAHSRLDGVHRLFTYARVGDLPLLVTVGMSTEKIYAGWRTQALFVVAVALILCLATFMLVMRLRSELKRRSDLERELETLARTDGLTKLANRRYFDQTIEREWSRAQRNGEWLALLMIDADRFKPFNDRYGHQEGDALLSWIALCIADAARRGTDFPARYGGEEFVVLLTSADRAMALQVAETIRHSVEMLQVDNADAPNGFASVSIGVAFARPDKDANPRVLIAAADRALFDAKRNGRNRIEFSDHNAGVDISVEAAPRLVA